MPGPWGERLSHEPMPLTDGGYGRYTGPVFPPRQPTQGSRCQICGLQVRHVNEQARLAFEDKHHTEVHAQLNQEADQ